VFAPLRIIEATVRKFLADNCAQMAAALSFYAFFSLPPLLILLLLLTGTVLEPAAVQARLLEQVESLIGGAGAVQVAAMLEAVTGEDARGAPGTLLGLGALLFGATAAFAQLQGALNRAWQVEPDPARGDIRNFLVKRVFSFAMIASLAFLLLISLVISALLAAFGAVVTAALPSGLSVYVVGAVHAAISFTIVAAIFALMFKVLPDAEVEWRDVRVGALTTAFLFEFGRWLIGLYLGRTDPASAYGAAGSLAIVLIWVYYSSMIMLGGAEFTFVWATRRGGGVRPEEGAVRVVTEKRRADDDAAQPAARPT
jgi:membrane protein